jgi:hypothetical protein
MNRFRLLLVAVGLVMLGIVLTQPVKATIQTQQAQMAVTIIVNVSPSPVAYVPHQEPGANKTVIAALSLDRAAPPALQRAFRAENLQFTPDLSNVVAQAQVQHGVLVQAEVTPNPKATILTNNAPGSTVILNQYSGTTVQWACVFTVTVDMTTAWSLEEGITSDFASNFPGKDLANNTYISTPLPTATPYIVYADDGSVWSGLGSGTAKTTYCVTLTLTIPEGVAGGAYVTNAIYTLFN